MWIPYDIRGALKPIGDRRAIAGSVADSSVRDFLVGFLVRNPVTQAWELDLAPPAGPLTGCDGTAITFSANEAGKVTEVIYRLSAPSAQEALERSFGDLDLRLSAWSARIGRGMAVAGWRVADLGHGARWTCTPFRPSTIEVDPGHLGPVSDDLAGAAGLARRARSATDAETRLLAATGALAILTGRDTPLRGGTASFTVAREMLVHAVASALEAELLGLSLDELLSRLTAMCRTLTAPEGFLRPGPVGLAAQSRLAAHANLADLVVHRLLASELAHRQSGQVAAQRVADDALC